MLKTTKKPGFVTSYDIRHENGVGLGLSIILKNK